MAESPPAVPTLTELLTAQFYAWERRGRGWQVWPEPVDLEPPFVPFFGHYVEFIPESYDDGQVPDSGFLGALKTLFRPALPEPKSEERVNLLWDEEVTIPLTDLCTEPIVEFQLHLPEELDAGKLLAEQFLLSLDSCRYPAAFELIGEASGITVQLACRESDARYVAAQITAHYPEIAVGQNVRLTDAWPRHGENVIVDFGLSREFMLPLRTHRDFTVDPLTGFLGALSELRSGEVGLLQVLFAPARCPWAENIFRAVTDWEGGSFFADAPDVVSLAREKISYPLFSAVIRVAAKCRSNNRAWSIVRALGGGLTQLAHPGSNELIPLTNDDYPDMDHEEDLLHRQSRRSGMLLSSDELVSLVHLPTDRVQSEALPRMRRTTKAAPVNTASGSIVLGENVHRGKMTRVTLTPEQRVRHTHVIGASGTGKSTLLLNMIVQDIEQGHGLALLDPHGDLADDVLARLPESRRDDVVLFDPADADWPMGFNILSAHSEVEKTLLSSDLVAVFRRLSTSWGDQMTSVLGNAILAFLESELGGTLADLRRFLVEPGYRKEFLSTVRDSEVVYYWQKEFTLLAGKPQAPLLTRLDTFLRPRLIRHIVCQKKNRLDFASIMNEGRIFLAKLAQGAVGEENAHLLGTLLVAKLHQITLSRQELTKTKRRDFFLYLDEFHNFITPSMAAILSGVRKYRLGLILAHQELRQLGSQDAEVLSAVLSNPCTRICFRVGDADAAKLAPGFSTFNAQDLQRLGVGEAIARVERADNDFNLVTQPLPPVDEERAAAVREYVQQRCRSLYAVPREEVERLLAENQTVVVENPEPVAEAIPAKPSESPLPTTTQTTVLMSQTAPAEPQMQPGADETVPTPVLPSRPVPRVRPKPTADTLMGKGGQQHKYLQELIKRFAEGLGYRATIEQPILDGQGQVDVALEKGSLKVACEISITTDAEHEAGNIQKCLATGFTQVVAIAPDAKRLEKVRKLASSRIAEADIQKVKFATPDDLLTLIEELEAQSASSEQTVRGYKVKVRYRPADEGEKETKKQAIAQVITRSIKRYR